MGVIKTLISSPRKSRFPSVTSSILVSFVLISVLEARSQEISIRGTVKSKQTKLPIQGARVSLEGDTLSTLTDATGAFVLGGSVGVITQHPINASVTVYSSTRGIVFAVPHNASISLSIFSFADGKRSYSLRKSGLNGGQWLVSPNLPTGMYVCKAQVNNTAIVFKYFAKAAGLASSPMKGEPTLLLSSEDSSPRLAKSAAGPAVLLVSRAGYLSKRDTLPDLVASGVAIELDSTSREPAVNFKGFNWADPRDNFVNGVLYISGLTSSSTYEQAQALAEMVCKTWQDIGANTLRLPINGPTVASPFWNVYKGIFDKATSMGFKVIFCAWTEDHSQKVSNLDSFWKMWDKAVADYSDNPLVYFEFMNEVSYNPVTPWVTICENWLKKYPSVPKGRVIIPGCGKNGERWSNQMGALSQFDSCLLAVHLYNPWDGAETDTLAWYNRAKTQIAPYADRTIVSEFGQSMAGGNNYMGGPNYNAVTAYMAGLTRYMRENKMGGTYWPGLRDNDSWELYKRNGTTSMTVTNQSGLTRVRYSWGLDN